MTIITFTIEKEDDSLTNCSRRDSFVEEKEGENFAGD